MSKDGQMFWWTQDGIEDLKDSLALTAYEKRGCPLPGDPVSQEIIDDEARLGFQPSWFTDLGHWAREKPGRTEEQMITSVWPPICPQELEDYSRIKCSQCGEHIEADEVEEHSRRCVSSSKVARTPKAALNANLDEVSSSDPAWAMIVDLLETASLANTAHYRFSLRLKRLCRVRYSGVLPMYEAEAAKLGVESMQLFYGCKLDAAQKVANEGFRVPEKAGPFGKGVHFVPCPLTAASLSPENSWMPLAKRIVTKPWAVFKKENGHMILCDIHVGTPLTLRRSNNAFNPVEDLKGGWLRSNLGLGDYDSVYAPGGFFGAVSVDEYVVYKPQQALPRYLLEFKYVYGEAAKPAPKSTAFAVPAVPAVPGKVGVAKLAMQVNKAANAL